MRQYWKLHHPFLTYATSIHIDKVAAQNVNSHLLRERFLFLNLGIDEREFTQVIIDGSLTINAYTQKIWKKYRNETTRRGVNELYARL